METGHHPETRGLNAVLMFGRACHTLAFVGVGARGGCPGQHHLVNLTPAYCVLRRRRLASRAKVHAEDLEILANRFGLALGAHREQISHNELIHAVSLQLTLLLSFH